MTNPRHTGAYRTWAKRVLAQCEPVCIRCGEPIDMGLPGTHPQGPTADHEPPLALTGDVTPTLEGGGISHNRCNVTHGAKLGAALRQQTKTQQRQTRSFKQPSLTPAAPYSDTPRKAQKRPKKRRTGPDGFQYPRLETGPHKAATGSHGDRALAWLENTYGLTLRPFQAYIVRRALEHDSDGQLVWPIVISTVARQMGKSYLARAICMWRLHEGRELFGKEQTVLHVANKRETAMEVMRPAGLWASEKYGKRAVKWGNTSAGIWLPEGDRWLIHAANESAGVGYSVDMAFLDEAWRIRSTVWEDAISPTMAAMPSPQGWLVSTAGDSDSDLLLSYRQRAIDRLGSDDPGEVLLLEWSAPPDADPDVVETWKWASPEWDERREKFLRTRWASGDPDSWRTQFLNQWIRKSDSWLSDADWEATRDPEMGLPADGLWHACCETDFDGMGHAVAVAAQAADGLIPLRVTLHRTFAEVDAQLQQLRQQHHQIKAWATPSYRERLRTPFEMVGQREAAAATQAIMDAFTRRQIRHDGSAALLEHFTQSVISRRQAGWALTAPMGKAGVYAARAAMFAVWQASKVQSPPAAIHVRRRG